MQPVVRLFQCRCGLPIFFRNSFCLNCQAPLGYEPNLGRLFALDPGPEPNTCLLVGDPRPEPVVYVSCANLHTAASCNWLLPAEGAAASNRLCISCRLNRTIPDLSLQGNAEAWRQIEIAKRRLISQLVLMGLPVASKINEDPQRGLAFDFLADAGQRVTTGHDNGLITLNIEEADDVARERIRNNLREPYRTLLGHMRHESGHYYWDRLVDQTNWIYGFRELFGDERPDYAEALDRHYQQGPPADWPAQFVSAYASAHPWEDWAETWAHYLHMIETYDTAASFGFDDVRVRSAFQPFTEEALYDPSAPGAKEFLSRVNSWTPLAAVVNELTRAMGHMDFYPFVLSIPLVRKLHFIHMVVEAAAQRPQTASNSSSPNDLAA